jgi:hypothetical protein
MLDDYEALLAHSAEAAWAATESSVFNHATDRVANLDALVAAQRRLGRPIKERIEVFKNGRLRQTAFDAAQVTRSFGVAGGPDVKREGPGSFHEFIERGIDPATGRLDLGFDRGNATGIFAMTRARP